MTNQLSLSPEEFVAGNPGVNPLTPDLEIDGVVLVESMNNVTGGGAPAQWQATWSLAELIQMVEEHWSIAPWNKEEILQA